MKRIIVLVVLILGAFAAQAQNLPYLSEPTFKAGERLKYRLKYGILNAATASLSVDESKIKFGTGSTFHLSAFGETSGAFSLYTVKNKYDSYINPKTLQPYLYTENIREGSYRRVEYATFDHSKKTVSGKKGTFTSPTSQFFDLVSAYYFARNLDLSSLKSGDKFDITYFLSDEVTQLGIEYIGVETINTPIGKVECIKLSPEISPGRIFKKDSKMYLWVTNDGNRVPVRAKADILVGSVTLELTDAEGLKYKLGERVSYSK